MRFSLIRLLCLLVVLTASCTSDTAERTSQESTPAATETTPAEEPTAEKTILFFGNSLSAGYGVDPSEAFPSLVQDRIDSLGLPYKVVNAGVSGETTSGGMGRIDWVLRQPVDVFVLELGGNDGLRGIPLAETRKNLEGIIDKVRAKYPSTKIILAGMQIPPNMGRTYTEEFRTLYPELAEHTGAALIPFLLEGVGGVRELNQADGIHPTPQGHRILADNVWEVLEREL